MIIKKLIIQIELDLTINLLIIITIKMVVISKINKTTGTIGTKTI